MEKSTEVLAVVMYRRTCQQCAYVWQSQNEKSPRQCPKCWSRRWNQHKEAEVEAMLSRRLAQNPPVGVSPDRGQAIPSKKAGQTSGDGNGESPGAN